MVILKRFTSNKILFLLLAILFSIISSYSLFHSGLLPTHDGEYHVIRFFEFDKVLRDGNLYPRWAPDLNNGFGIPLFNYVYPLPNYTASFFHFLGFSFIDSFKLTLLFAVIFSAIFMYLWSRQFWGDLGGLASSVFYTFSPYHFLDIYIRGSVGEVWAIAFFPAFLWAITKFVKERNYKYFVLSSIFISFIIFSHNILAFMFFFVGFSYAIFLFFNSRKKSLSSSSILSILSIFVLGVGIASVFWFPAILERNYVRGLEVYDYSRNFPEFYQLIFPSWGSGFSSGSLQDQLSFQIGVANLLAVLAGIILVFKKLKGIKRKNILIFFLIWFLIVFLLMLKVSVRIWEIFPFMNYFQFPWRFLSLEILFASFMAGGLVSLPKSKFIVPFTIILSITLGFGYTNVAYYLERSDNYYTTRPNFINSTNSPGNSFNTIWIKNAEKKEDKLVFTKGRGSISAKTRKTTYYSFSVNAKEKGELMVSTAYFPGWTVYIDGKVQKSTITEEGLFSFPVTSGRHEIQIKFEDSAIRKIATAISLISIIVLFTYPRFAKIKVETFVSQRS